MTIHFFRNSYCFPRISELQFPYQQPSADHSLIRLLPSTVVTPVEIDGGSQILEPLSMQMGAVIHSAKTTMCPSGQQATATHVSQSRVLLGNKQPPCTVITYKYHYHVSFWTSKRQHVSQSRVLLGNKHPVYRAVIHNVINMCPGRAPGKNITDNLQSQTRVHSEQQRTGTHASQ
jgi:hypothetical protein